MRLVRSMMRKASFENCQSSSLQTLPVNTTLSPARNNLSRKSWGLSGKMTFSFYRSCFEDDDFSKFKASFLSGNKRSTILDDNGIIQFRVSKMNTYHTFFQVTLRIIAVPASNCTNERESVVVLRWTSQTFHRI